MKVRRRFYAVQYIIELVAEKLNKEPVAVSDVMMRST